MTTARLGPGRWRLHTVSNGRLRVWVDGELKIDAWQQRPLVRAQVALQVDEPRDVLLRVEHCNDGTPPAVVMLGLERQLD